MVAQQKPQLVAPYASHLIPLLSHKTTKVRWEATHALALVAHLVSDAVEPILPQLQRLIDIDSSIIVRDYAIDVIANFAKADKTTALKAFPILLHCLDVWEGRHCGHALQGFIHAAKLLPQRREEIRLLAEKYVDHKKAAVKKIAKQLLKVVSI